MQQVAGRVHLPLTLHASYRDPWHSCSGSGAAEEVAAASVQALHLGMRFLPSCAPSKEAVSCKCPAGLQHLGPDPQDWYSVEQAVHAISPAGLPDWKVLMARMPVQSVMVKVSMPFREVTRGSDPMGLLMTR